MSALVYQAVNAITAELAEIGIAKTRWNEEGNYAFRSIEDVLAALAPLLARHRLCVLPRILSRDTMRSGRASQLVSVHAAFDLVSALDGSLHTIESFGEAIDDSDKGTAKAISSAYKSAMLQAFCIPVGAEDADAASPPLNGSRVNGVAVPEPPEGWEAWASEVTAIATSCESAEAIDRLMTMRRPLLGALQRSRPELYSTIGEAIAAKLDDLQRPRPRAGTMPAGAGRASLKSAKRSSRPAPDKQSQDYADATRAAAEAA